MAYVTTNPPQVLVPSIGARPTIWSYESADVDSVVNGAGYITDALELGMKIGDMVWVFDTTTPLGSVHYVLSFTASAANLGFAAVA